MNNREAFEAQRVLINLFERWKGYELPDLNSDNQFDKEWLHREWVAFQAGYQAALASQAQQPSEALKEMEARKDAAYLERNQVVAALAKCFPSGIAKTAIEGWSEDWHGCVYIDLPTGQASWHFHDSQAYLFADLPAYTGKWDGHTTEEKYRRVSMLAAQAQQEAIGEVQHYAAPANLPAYVNVKWYGKPPKNGAKVYAIPPAPEGDK